jgi:hypothetical protein
MRGMIFPDDAHSKGVRAGQRLLATKNIGPL